MQNLLDQIQKGLEADLYYLSLFAALAIPDICGAIDFSASHPCPKWNSACSDIHKTLYELPPLEN